MKCFGLTGGIASGKSTVSAMLKAAHIPVIDADILARRVVEPGTPGHEMIAQTFGRDFLQASGTLDRARMAKLVFSDADARKKLEDIVHPLIANELQQELKKLEAEGVPYVVYEAPLIFEKGLHHFFDATILVTTPTQVQVDRLTKRDKIGAEEALARLRAQMQTSEKEKLADFTIQNVGTLEQTQEELKRVWLQLTGEPLTQD